MNTDLLKTSGWTITAALLFLLSFITPLLVAPILLMAALVSGWLGYFQKEWGGRPPIVITLLSFIFLVVVLNRLYFAQ
jgi:hypothetical protein